MTTHREEQQQAALRRIDKTVKEIERAMKADPENDAFEQQVEAIDRDADTESRVKRRLALARTVQRQAQTTLDAFESFRQKLLSLSGDSPVANEEARLQREARQQALLDHPRASSTGVEGRILTDVGVKRAVNRRVRNWVKV